MKKVLVFHRTTRRLGLLAACMAFVACASAPEPTSSTKKRKKSRKDRIELKEKREAKKRKKKREAEERKREREREEREQEEQEAAPPDDDVVTITDDTSVDEGEKKKKKKETRVAFKPKKKEKEPEEEEEEAEEEEEPEKPTKVAARTKQKKAKRKASATVDMTDVEEDEPPPRAKPAKQAKKPKQNDDEPVDENMIEMDGTDDEEPERRVAAIPVPGVDDDDDAPIDEPEPETPGAPANPLSINERPLTLAKDRLAFHGGLRVGVLTLPGPTPADPGVSSTATGLGLGATYGLSDKAEVGADYTLGVSPGTVKGPFTARVVYRAVEGKKLDFAIAAGLAVDFFEQTNTITMTTTTTTFAGLHLGAWARYRVNRKASLFTGVPALPTQPATMTKLAFPLPPLPYQLAIGLNNGGAIALDVPVGVGYQATPKIYGFAMLNLAHLRIANTQNAFLFADFIPFVLGGFYSLPKIDVGAVFSDDLKQGTDYLRFEVTMRYFLK